ncbi:hypothetical protein NC651_000882 [Populus alba x Populus x berolinensis]|nr:hypothetical protein NC651_000882 [Populus alba x Populus x berolinensis]
MGLCGHLLVNLRETGFQASLDETSMKSLYGYKVFLAVALILGDGLYNFVKVMVCTIINVHGRVRDKKLSAAAVDHQKKHHDDQRVNETFLRETIPLWVAVIGYVAFSILSVIAVPIIFPQLKWYYVIAAYVLAPSLAFCNAYGSWSNRYKHGL